MEKSRNPETNEFQSYEKPQMKRMLKYTEDNLTEIEANLKKITDLKIYLRRNVNRSDLNEQFIARLSKEYAALFLEKIGIKATPVNVEKLIKLRPLENCEYQLVEDKLKGKSVKVLQIFPNKESKNTSNIANIQKGLTMNNFENIMRKTELVANSSIEESNTLIKKKEVSKEEMQLYQPQSVDLLLHKAKDGIEDKKLFVKSQGEIEQQSKCFDLRIETIRKKYINPSSQIIINNREDISAAAKFQNIDKVAKKEIINNKAFEFPFLDLPMSKEYLTEVTKPFELSIEVIVKDINYILDNFPVDQLIQIDELPQVQNPKDPNKVSDFKKIKTINKKDLLAMYKLIQSEPVYRLIGLFINLAYWSIFGHVNRIQIDRFTKQQLLFKVLEEQNSIEMSFSNKARFSKIFMPIFLLILRIESESIFLRKFKEYFEHEEVKDKAVEKINELITTIFDPNCYYNTFTFLGYDVTKLKHKMNHNLYPNYKKKINATSNLVNQLFTKFSHEKNIKNFYKGKDAAELKKKKLDKEGTLVTRMG